jgi:anti-anti-sigma factor
VRNVELRTRVRGGYLVVMLRGELDTRDAEDTATAVAALTAGGQQLIIDLETLDFIDCHAAGALLRVRETARQAGGDVLLAAPHGPVLRLLTFLDMAGVYASVAAAADSADSREAVRATGPGPRGGCARVPGCGDNGRAPVLPCRICRRTGRDYQRVRPAWASLMILTTSSASSAMCSRASSSAPILPSTSIVCLSHSIRPPQ